MHVSFFFFFFCARIDIEKHTGTIDFLSDGKNQSIVFINISSLEF